jgi:N-sulfoglucosamine sulfohydrolase
LIIYIGDHGAQFSRGKGSVYEAGLRVPFIVHWRGRAAPGQVRTELISTLDILPTLAAAAGVKPPEALPGRNLIPLIEGGRPDRWREYVFGVTTGAAPAIFHLQHSVRDSRWKLISNPVPGRINRSAVAYLENFNVHFSGGTRASEIAASSAIVRDAYARYRKPPRYELYDLENDAGEWRDLAADPDHAETKARLVSALEHWQSRTRDPLADRDIRLDFVERQDAMTDLDYRKRSGFRWPYLDRFLEYMER